jgi:hypothetical protein
MDAVYSSATSVDFQRTAWRYIPEDGVLFITTAVITSNPTEEGTLKKTMHHCPVN